MDVTSNHLSIYLERIYTFLISNVNSQVFSGLTMAMEDVMVNIAEDADYLKNGMLDDDCKSQAAKIVSELEKKKHVYTLTYAFEIDEHYKKVMVYKKTLVPVSLKQLRKPKAVPTNASVSTSVANINTVMTSFITSSLNATLKFVKDDSRLVLQYPDMSTEQAQFVKQMMSQCMTASDGKDTGPCCKGLYDPLAEALKIFSLKYEFKLNDAAPNSFDMKRLVFEKIPKQSKNKTEKDLVSNSSTTSSEGSCKLKRAQTMMKNVPEQFQTQAFLEIREFMSDNTESLTFDDVTLLEEQFITSWKMFLKPENVTYFPEEVQKILGEIKELIGLARGKFTVRTTMEKISKTRRTVYLEKKWTYKSENSDSPPVPKVNNNIRLNSMPEAKVNTKNTAELDDKNIFLKHKDRKIEVNNNHLNSLPVVKVNTENREDSDEDDFIAIRNTVGSILPIKQCNLKTRSLVKIISEIDGKFARFAITAFIDFHSGPEETLLFQNHKREELDFLLRWEEVVKRVEIIRMFSIPGQMALDELRTMVDKCAGSFKVVESKTPSPNNNTLTFVKQYVKKKQLKSALEDNELPISKSNLSSKIKLHDYIQDIPQSWIKKTLNQLKEFLQDSLQGSLLLPTITPSQNEFLLKWQTMTRKDVLKIFGEDIQRIFKDIRETVDQNRHKFVISLKVGKITKNGTRDATLVKCPSYPLLPSQNEKKLKSNAMPEKSQPKPNDSKIDIPSQSRRMRELENKYAELKRVENKDEIPVIPAPDKKYSEKNQPTGVENKDENPFNPVALDQRDVPRGVFKAASVTSLPGKPCGDVKARPKSASTAKAKIIEALNQPLVSERGLKMMRMMGWEGGALGARGEGIMEPIALNLDQGKRAGLGCVIPTPKQHKIRELSAILPPNVIRRTAPNSPPRNVMRTVILAAIEELVSTVKTDTHALELVSPVTSFSKKAWKFVRQILTAVNSRTTNIDLPDSPILLNIMERMKETDFVITACFGFSAIHILFVLSKDIYQPSEHDRKHWFDIINIENCLKSIKTLGDRTEECVVVTGDAFREYVMAQILAFCKKPIDKEKKPNKVSQEIKLRGIMAHKQMSYIQDVIKRLNSRSLASCDKMQGCFDEIVATMRGFDLHVDFPGTNGAGDIPIFKCIRLHKIFYAHHVISPYYEKSKSDTSDMLSIHSMISINKLLKKTTTNIDSESNNTSTKYYTDNEKAKDAHKTCDQKNQLDKPTATIDSQNAQSNIQNSETKDECMEKRTINDLFDGRCLIVDEDAPSTSQNTSTPSQHAAMGSQNTPESTNQPGSQSSQISPVSNQNALTGSPFVASKDSQIVLMPNQNTPTGNPIEPKNSQVESISSQNAAMDMGSQIAPMLSYFLFQNAPTPSQNAAIDSQSAPMTSQPAAMISQSSQILPMPSQIAALDSEIEILPTTSQNAVMSCQNVLTDEDDTDIFGDCLCCVHYYCTPEIKVAKKDCIERNKEKETASTENIASDEPEKQEKESNSHRQDSEGHSENENVDGTSVKTRVQYFNTNGLKAIIDGCISRIECKEDVKKTLTELKDSIFLHISEKPKLKRLKESLDQKVTNKVLGKRACSSNSKPHRLNKKFKNTESVKRISITPKNYPQNEITNEMAGEIQKSVINSIDYSKELPLLECHGIQDGALMYTCHSEQTFNFIDNLTQSLHLKVTVEESEKTYHKLTVRIHSFIDESIDRILDRLEIYNTNLNTKDWKVLSLEKICNSLVMHLEIDDSSFEFVVKENFMLYAGTDQAKFSIVWD